MVLARAIQLAAGEIAPAAGPGWWSFYNVIINLIKM